MSAKLPFRPSDCLLSAKFPIIQWTWLRLIFNVLIRRFPHTQFLDIRYRHNNVLETVKSGGDKKYTTETSRHDGDSGYSEL